MSKTITMAVDKQTYNNPEIRKEVEQMVLKAMPESMSVQAVTWSCLLSLDGLEHERWVCSVSYEDVETDEQS